MKRLALPAILAACALAAPAVLAPAAQASFGFPAGSGGFSAAIAEENGSPNAKAGSHPYSLEIATAFNLAPGGSSEGDVRDLSITLPPGLVLNPSVVAQCSKLEFATPRNSPFQQSHSGESCADKSQVGTLTINSSFDGGSTSTFGLFSLAPPPGAPAQLGARPYGMPITFTPQVRDAAGGYGLSLIARNVSQQLDIRGLEMELWGNPWLVGHDLQRGNCLNEADPSSGFGTPGTLEREPQTIPGSPPFYEAGDCSTGNPKTFPPRAYLTMPASCEGPLAFAAAASSWQGEVASAGATTPALSGCNLLSLDAESQLPLSVDRTTSATGIGFELGVGQDGLEINTTPNGKLLPGVRAPSQLKGIEVTLPQGMTINPSVGAGLGVCTPAQYAAESPTQAGCPNNAKLGELAVQAPLLEGTLGGSIYLAQPDDARALGAENPFGSLLALYLVFKSPQRGVIVKVAGKVTANPGTGQLVASFEGLPPLPYSSVSVRFRDGQRSPLATPSTCGDYTSTSKLTPYHQPASSLSQVSQFKLKAGIGGAGCPQGTPPFTPKSVGGTLNRNAGSYAPFYLHLTRGDAEQEITSYSASFPKGLLGNISNVPYCPEAAIATAAQNSGFAEAANPSCPAASSIGRTVSGYGLGNVLAYAPGGLYLAGPYHGSTFSIVAVDSATVGPFDLGVIIVRSAIRVDRRTAQVSIDSAGSDPIPHIIDGIPIHLRDVRVYLDRPRLTINPTSCNHYSVASVLTGSGASFGTQADDSTAGAANPFQVSNCSALGFKPKLELKLKGGTRRGKFPSLKATVTPRPGDANIGGAQVTLPPSLFLEQSHLETICTRPQFAANACPAGSVYGTAKATTPLLGAPIEGPVYLRASDNPLPDLVAALRGQVDIDVVGKIDSYKAGLRATFGVLPDAPVSKFELTLRGGKRGVLAAAENLCKGSHRALSKFWSQGNAPYVTKPKLTAKCKGKKGKAKGKRKGKAKGRGAK